MTTPVAPAARTPPRRLAAKYSRFTALIVFWVAFVIAGNDLRESGMGAARVALLAIAVPLVAVSVAVFTNRLLARPIGRLQEGIDAVRQGKLDRIPAQGSGDEIEYLGDSLNEMLLALRASRDEAERHQREVEEQLRKQTAAFERGVRDAQSANDAKSRFLAEVSQDLRAPMTGVLGMLNLVLEGELKPAQRENLETARECAHTLLSVVSDVRDLAALEAGRLKLDAVACDLLALLEESRQLALPRCRRKGIELRVDVEPELPQWVTADPARLRQILDNLISNAVELTDSGWVEVTATATAAGAATRRISFRVTDTGAGIAREKVPEMLEKFPRAEGGYVHRRSAGLGLTIANQLAKLYGGGVRVESELGRGSSVFAELTLSLAEAPPEPPAGVASKAVPSQPRVLVVEDDDASRKVVTAVLRKAGYVTESTANGRACIEKLKESSFDLVVMDIQMPEMDGISAAKAIRQNSRWRSLPIIAMTSGGVSGARQRCIEAGMNAYVSKPVPGPHLLSLVQRLLEQARVASNARLLIASTTSALPVRPAAPLRLEAEPGLQGGMRALFLKLSDSRLRGLRQAAINGDSGSLRRQSRKVAEAASQIDALEVARCAEQIGEVASYGNARVLQELLDQLEREIAQLGEQVTGAVPGPSK